MVSLGTKLRFLVIAGVGFFADGYLNLTIGLGMYGIFADGGTR
jgi:PHS family inorganic phosphate transporter-like MFS transporter